MGDRANVAIITDEGQPPIVLYTHWSGYRLPDALATAIDRARDRWGDDSYCARIIVTEILFELGFLKSGETTGFGLSVGSILDNEYPVFVVSVPEQAVWVVPENDARDALWGPPRSRVSFDLVSAGTLKKLRGDT